MNKLVKFGLVFGLTGTVTMLNAPVHLTKAAESKSAVEVVNSSSLGLENQSTSSNSKEAESQSTSSDANQSTNQSTSSSSSSQSISQEGTKSESTLTSQTVLRPNSEIGQGFYGQVVMPKMRLAIRTNTQAFLDSIHQGTINGWNKYGVLPSTAAAQAILESGWGRSGLTVLANNLFGIKGDYNGAFVNMPTQEYINGQWITINANFRKYPSLNESIEDHGLFLNINSRYHNLLWQTDYRTVTSMLQSDGYATSPTYAASLNNIIETYHLYDWDNEVININAASMDNIGVSGSNINVRGWHASSNANGKPYSYLIVLDADTNKELSRVKINRAQRTDVNNIYSGVSNSLNSGFDTQIPITSNMLGKKIKIISRYSATADGNGAFSDYHFGNVVTMPNGSAGNLDVVNQTQLDKINLKGWFAHTQSINKPYRYIILLDTANNKELGRYQVQSMNRPDVANAFPNITNSLNSGYTVTIPLTSRLLGKQVRAITRYSDDPSGNGHFVDYWNNGRVFNVRANNNQGWLDTLKQTGNSVRAEGWYAADASIDKKYRYLIVLDAKNNHEISRYKVASVVRSDVASAFPAIYGARNSGFDYQIPVTKALKGKKVRVISRYTDDEKGNGNFVDYWFSTGSIKVN